MKKVLLAVLLLIVVGVGTVLVLASTKPDQYTVVRSTGIGAPPEVVFGYVNDFHRWPEWSPWEKLDPAMKRTLSGAESGVGAEYAWVGNQDVGEGRMKITTSEPSSKIGVQLDFIKPFESSSVCDFALAPAEGGTQVTWTMTGNHNFMSKVMCVFVDMDQMIGKDFEKGLVTLKSVSESAAESAAADTVSTP
jgi:hypothetical protein